jgi:hypothetical protein
MTRPYLAEDGQPGRPKTETDATPPTGFSLHEELMKTLDDRGWYRELGRRSQLEKHQGDPHAIGPRKPDYPGLEPVTDPEELDRLMCRTGVVAECNTQADLRIAKFNGRVVVEIDPACSNEILFDEIAALLDQIVSRRRRNTKAWKKHRILSLYDLKILGYDLSSERKQLARWIFPEIDDETKRGSKFDRAKEHLETAVTSLSVLRAQSTS